MTGSSNIELYGLLGYPLSHSFSQKYFKDKFEREQIKNADYQNFELADINLLNQLLESNSNLKGFNVTIPYKETIIPFLDELDKNAAEIGAVNAVKCSRINNNFHLKGYNTDYYGFKTSLVKNLKGEERKALVLGNGGAAKAVVHALKTLNVDYQIVSRKAAITPHVIDYSVVNENLVRSADVIINTTPLGMWPNVDDMPDIPYHAITKNSIVFDLIYNPQNTKFLRLAAKSGAIVVNGLEMLKLQAEKAWEIFNS